MEAFQKFGLFGLILFILTVSIPLLLIASKGFKKDSYRGRKGEKSILGTAFLAILTFFVFPSLFFLIYNFVKLVLLEKMPLPEFSNNIQAFSIRPVIDFYSNIVTLIRAYIQNLFSAK